MDSVFLVDLILLALVVIIGIATVRSRSLLASTMLLGIYSLLMALVWANMFAMDVAFTEAAVGAGISTVLLLGTMVVVGREEKRTRGPHLPALLITLATGGALIYGTLDMPSFGDPKAPVHQRTAPEYIAQAVGHVHAVEHHDHGDHGDDHGEKPKRSKGSRTRVTHPTIGQDNHRADIHPNAVSHADTHDDHGHHGDDHDHHAGDFGTHVPNLVTAVLADYRSYDTMFETAVIFTAGVCLILLLRDPRKREEDEDEEANAA